MYRFADNVPDPKELEEQQDTERMELDDELNPSTEDEDEDEDEEDSEAESEDEA